MSFDSVPKKKNSMSQEKNIGNVSQMSSRQLEFISKVLNEKGFSDRNVSIKPVVEEGDNYMASVIRIVVEKNGEKFSMIAKIAPKSVELRMAMETRMMFLNEHVMYTEILPKFTELEKSAGIPEKERLRYATCYGSLADDFDELILLEDLMVSDFIMLDKFKPLNENEIKLVLKSFSRLHALSYVLKNKQQDLYNSFKSKLSDVWDITSMEEPMKKQLKDFFKTFEDECIDVCDAKYEEVIKGTVSEIFELSDELRNFDDNSKFSVIQQGDSWTNNILFKFQEGKAASCCIIDYQISKVTSPVADILYFLLTCVDHETRKRHFIEWINYYHKELEEYLREFGLKVDEIYPRIELDNDLKRHAKFSIALLLFRTSLFCREAAAGKELKSAMENLTEVNMADNMAKAFTISMLDEKQLTVIKSKLEGILETCLHFDFF